MVAVFLTIIISFFITSLFGYVVHWSLHQKWAGILYKAHRVHHFQKYPISDFISDTYRQAGINSTPKFFFIGALPLIIVPIVLWHAGIMPLSIMITVLIVEAIMGFLHNYLHDAFHIRNHWLYRVPVINKWFSHWFKLHYLHHYNIKKNFGICNFFWDRVFGSFWKIDKSVRVKS
jgi:sterol desaturase/sphingolipid hydroxylase (fatty acid hydroxylase superfamily)